MFKFGIVVLSEREKTDMTDTDVSVGWMLQPTAGAVVKEREKDNVT
jgi:hypothetical protein